MENMITVRFVKDEDFDEWKALWDGYQAFYGNEGDRAIPEYISTLGWSRFFNENELIYAMVAEVNGKILGIVHYLFQISTSSPVPLCYLETLFTNEAVRGRGIGKALIHAVYMQALRAGSHRVYWLTQEHNITARHLYDQVANKTAFIVYSKDV